MPPLPQDVPQPAVGMSGPALRGATGGLRIEDQSGSLNSPILISCTRENPSVITVMFEVTTASPKRLNFLTYCLRTVSENCSSVMPLSFKNGDTLKNAPRNELPCMRNCNSGWVVAFFAMSKPGKMKTRMLLSMTNFRCCAGTRCHATSGESLDSQTRQPPFLMPSSGFVCVNALGSQHSTTTTWFNSQFTLICSRATVR